MRMTFGQRLKQFANTIDIVEPGVFKQTITLIEDYVSEVLKIQVVRIMVEGTFNDGEPALFKYRLSKVEPLEILLLSDPANEYKGQMPFAYFNRKPLWIVSATGREELSREGIGYRDLWSSTQSIPHYLSAGEEGVRTSIIIPLKNGDHRVYGVVNFETTDYLEIYFARE